MHSYAHNLIMPKTAENDVFAPHPGRAEKPLRVAQSTHKAVNCAPHSVHLHCGRAGWRGSRLVTGNFCRQLLSTLSRESKNASFCRSIGPFTGNHIDSVEVADKTLELNELLDDIGAVTVLTGAGVSTGSGIPDYRDRDGQWKSAPPMQFAEFAGSDTARQRYWARSYVGWQRFGTARPNPAHHALAKLEAAGKVDTVITQNVDRLHSRAGSENVIDLHGDLGKVRCIDCNETSLRHTFQRELKAANPDWHAQVFRYRPDGDVELAEDSHTSFTVPGCTRCGGRIKPDVVMFGESVPKGRVEDAMSAVDRSDALLIAGSSLMVFSGFRFARRAHETGKPIAIVNRGKTRADELATVKVDADCGEILSQLCSRDTADARSA